MTEKPREASGPPDHGAVHSDGPAHRPGASREGRPAPRRKRASKRVLRVLAWAAGAASFLFPWAVLTLAPKPVAAAATQNSKVIVRHRVVHRVIWQQAPVTTQPRVRYVYVSGGGGGSSPVSTGGSHP
jgi:hypothetical protein